MIIQQTNTMSAFLSFETFRIMGRQRRDTFLIVSQVLRQAEHGSSSTKIIEKCRFSYPQFRRYKKMLLNLGLLRAESKCFFVTTEKGFAFLRLFDEMMKLLVLERKEITVYR